MSGQDKIAEQAYKTVVTSAGNGENLRDPYFLSREMPRVGYAPSQIYSHAYAPAQEQKQNDIERRKFCLRCAIDSSFNPRTDYEIVEVAGKFDKFLLEGAK